MALVDMRDMLHHAYENSYAVGAFDLVSLDFLEAVIGAAERCRAPVILSIAEPHFAYYDFQLMLPAVEAAARRATVPVAIQLDHGSSVESAVEAIRLGCNGVMLDASDMALPDNIKATRAVVETAHACGIPVVGEVGYVAGEEGEGARQHPGQSAMTQPAEAKAYVERTGVDFLAVSIGTVQGRMKGRAKLDFQRLKQIRKVVHVPLVIHGGTGLNEDQFRRLTAMGIAKINYFTALSDVAAETMRQRMKSDRQGGFTDLKRGVKEAIGKEVERCLRLWGTAGRAAEVLAQCRPVAPVEKIVAYNIHGIDEEGASLLLRKAQEVISGTPGVREVFAGEAIAEGAGYRFCWSIRFATQIACETFRNHPAWLAFLQKFFDPVVGDFLSVDYRAFPGRVEPRESNGALRSDGAGSIGP